MLKIGLFSLKDGVGCTALSIHIANFIAGSSEYSTALIERRATKQTPEFHRFKGDIEDDGTFVINNVHFYPQQKLKNYATYPFKYDTINTKSTEDVQIYDFGAINFMYEFPDQMDKLYLVTDADEFNIEKIQKFRIDLNQQYKKEVPFDLILVGASRDQINVFKEGLPGITSIITVPDKKEIRIDYMFSVKLQIMFRSSGCGLTPPEFHNEWTYKPVEFFTEDEWIKKWTDKAKEEEKKRQEAEKKKGGLFKRNKQKEPKTEESSKPIEIPDSEIKVANNDESILNANVFEIPTFDMVPAPTFEESLKEDEPDVKNEKPVQPIIKSIRPEPKLEPKLHKGSTDHETIEEISKVSESFEPEKVDYDVSGEFKEHIVYEHDVNASGLIGDVIEGINRGGHFCCNLFIVTNQGNLFVFSKMDTFFDKLDALKREIGDSKNIHYAVLSFNDENREPRLFSNDEGVTLDVYKQYLMLLDGDLRTKRKFSDADIKKHKELTVFEEVIYA